MAKRKRTETVDRATGLVTHRDYPAVKGTAPDVHPDQQALDLLVGDEPAVSDETSIGE